MAPRGTSGDATTIASNLRQLPLDHNILAEYVWIDGSMQNTRSKTKTLDFKPTSVDELPEWNFDGSSTDQAPGHDSEVILKPRAIFKDPFRGGDNVLVLCDCYTPAGEPLPTNTRHAAAAAFAQKPETKPWFGIEQEYVLFETDGKTPLGWPKGGFPGQQGPFYCGAGSNRIFGRDFVEAHYRACLYAGIKVSGINAEVMPSQWEFQIGPCVGIESGDHMWMARYLMNRVGELYNIVISLDPKPIPDYNGSGAHTNYSTEEMRNPGGYAAILKAIDKLGKKHMEHIKAYDAKGGEDNKRRLTGIHETARYDQFSFGVANRGASIRIPRTTEAENCGYLEDRRPASNMDPYVVTSKIFTTTVLEN